MKKLFLDLLIVIAVLGLGVLLSMGFRKFAHNDTDAPKATKLETVEEISDAGDAADNAEFENFVVKKFDFSRSNLSLLEHNVDEGREQANLLIEMDTDNESVYYMLAVECLWRKEISSKGLYWTTESALKKYMGAADDDDAKLFLIFGLGGTPTAPKSIHIVPIKFLQQCFLSPSDLAYYKCESTSGLFDYDVSSQRLILR